MTVGLAERLISRSPVPLTTVAHKAHTQRIRKRLLGQPQGDPRSGAARDLAARMVRTGEDWRRPCFPHTTGTKGSAAVRSSATPLTTAVLPQQRRGTGRQPSHVAVPATVRTSRTGETKHTEQCTRHKVCTCNFSGRYLGFPHEH